MPRPRKTVVTCAVCEEEFVRLDNHAGYANTCLNCGGKDVSRLMAEVSWENKHTPIIRVTDAQKATLFNAQNSRRSCTVLTSVMPSAPIRTEPFSPTAGRDYMPAAMKEDDEGGKRNSGAELGEMYHSPLGEKHHLKR